MWKAAAAAAAAGVLCLVRSGYERKALAVETIEIETEKIGSDRTLVFLSDLHNNEFGIENRQLLEAIERVHPDAVLSGGDMLVTKGGGDDRVPLALFRQLVSLCPVYCGNGNHENRMVWKREIYGRQYEEYRKKLEDMGVICLEDSSAWLGKDLRITGLDLEECFYGKLFLKKAPAMPEGYMEKKLGSSLSGSGRMGYEILLAHTPLYFKEYAEWGADLTLAGHFHGGTIRLPGLGGVMTPQYQFFLPWCAGTFSQGEKRMIVSRGLGTHSINIRLNNRPQLAVIQLKKR